MKRLLLIALGIVCYHVVTFAQEVKVEVRGIRSAKGAIMVMAQQDSESKPVYAMATAVFSFVFSSPAFFPSKSAGCQIPFFINYALISKEYRCSCVAAG